MGRLLDLVVVATDAPDVAELARLIRLLAAHRPDMWLAEAIEEAKTVCRADIAAALTSLRALAREIPAAPADVGVQVKTERAGKDRTRTVGLCKLMSATSATSTGGHSAITAVSDVSSRTSTAPAGTRTTGRPAANEFLDEEATMQHETMTYLISEQQELDDPNATKPPLRGFFIWTLDDWKSIMQDETTMTYLIAEVLQTAAYPLQAVGCDRIDPLTVELTAGPGSPPENGLTPADLQMFQSLHLAARKLLGEEPHAPDLRPARDLSREERERLATAYNGPAARWTTTRRSSPTKSTRKDHVD